MSTTKNASNAMPVPCGEWAENLAATHPDDLSLTERAALNKHVATCAACAAVYDEYRSMDAHILALPAVAPLPEHMMQSEQLEEAPKERPVTVPTPIRPALARSRSRMNRMGKMLSTLAAVLVVSVIVGGFVLLFSTNRTGGIAGTPGATGSVAVYVATDVANSVAYAINPVNGSIIWKHTIGHKLTGPAVVANGLVLFASYNGYVYAYHTKDGSPAWQAHVGSGDSSAPSLSDTASGGTIYLATLDGNFFALRLSNGSIMWKRSLSTCTTCGAFVIQVENGIVYSFSDGLYALRASNGAVLWHNSAIHFASRSFTAMNGRVFVLGSSMRSPNILVLRASDGHQIDTMQGLDFVGGNGILYVMNANSTWYAMRVSDGTILWRSKSAGCSGSTLSGGTIYSAVNVSMVGNNGQSGYSEICAMSTSDGTIRWDWRTPDLELVNTPVELNGVAYFEHNSDLEARRASDGKLLWDVPFPAQNLQGPTVG